MGQGVPARMESRVLSHGVMMTGSGQDLGVTRQVRSEEPNPSGGPCCLVSADT